MMIQWFQDTSSKDLATVGGKNASLGEMTQRLADTGIRIPPGFATTADAYRRFLEAGNLNGPIADLLAEKDRGRRTLAETGSAIRELITGTDFPPPLTEALIGAYRTLSERVGIPEVDVAVRSSATAEDLPEASFAGQLESFLNVRGEEALVETCRRCFASLFTDRAIAYREAQGFEHLDVALSVGVQQMVRSNEAGAGVLFTVDTETGFPDVVMINAAWGLGETVVKGEVTPDQYTVYTPFLGREEGAPLLEKTLGAKRKKLIYGPEGTTETVATSADERASFVLSDEEIQTLARWGAVIEDHYGRPMDVEWAKDGPSGTLFIVQARPETVVSRREASALKSYRLKETGVRLVRGQAIGEAIATGKVCKIHDASEQERFPDDGILVTGSTDPDWVPIMKRAAGIVTDHGGRTSHAAIVSRELGLPAVVGTGDATKRLSTGQHVTISCAEEKGIVYDGALEFEVTDLDLSDVPSTDTAVMINVASPAVAMRWWRLPVRGVGLARIEYVINNVIRVHPLALTRFEEVEDAAAREEIEKLTSGYDSREEYFVDHLSRSIATIAASQYPDPVVVRTSDFKTNEYAHLIGGEIFEPDEENPMLGWRGASRYYSDAYRDGFALECRALRRVRDEMGFTNVVVMIPFCRTPEEGDRVLEAMAEHGLRRGENDLQVYVMAEIPSNVTLAAEFAERFDGFSIGSNDLTQLVLGVDRDSDRLAYLFDERHPAVTNTIETLIEVAHRTGTPVGICGQAPSDYSEFTAFLVEAGISSISVLPDSVLGTLQTVAKAETKRKTPADVPTVRPHGAHP
jgi:pyruvate,water dikinase